VLSRRLLLVTLCFHRRRLTSHQNLRNPICTLPCSANQIALLFSSHNSPGRARFLAPTFGKKKKERQKKERKKRRKKNTTRKEAETSLILA
jgi:hypothetical protein